MTFQWAAPPDGELYLWVRVEERKDPAVMGSIIASNGPDLYIPGEPLTVEINSVPNGDDRVVVVEARLEPNSGLPVLYYGISRSFSLRPGEQAELDVVMKMTAPAVESTVAGVILLFDNLEVGAVAQSLIHSATIRTRSNGAMGIVVANDASFTAGLKAFTLAGTEAVTCVQEEEGEKAWDVCQVTDWDMTDGLPSQNDGLYSVYLKFVDFYGYESKVHKASVLLDTQPPALVLGTVSPPVAHSGQTVVISLDFHEALHGDLTLAHLHLEPETTKFQFAGPQRVGESNSYVWTADIPQLEQDQGSVYTFSVDTTDPVGNALPDQKVVDANGDIVELRIDGVAPKLPDELPIDFNHSSFGIPGEGFPVEGYLKFEFVIEEQYPHPVGADDEGLCIGLCPEVRLANKKLGKVYRRPDLDQPGKHRMGFSYGYVIDSGSWGAVEQQIEVSINWADAAGNLSEIPLDETVSFDFKRPDAVNCLLVPESSNAETTIRYLISVTEPLLDSPVLSISSVNEGLFDLEPTNSEDGHTYTWEQDPSGLEEGYYELEASLRDKSGNYSDGPVCALTGTVDATSPALAPLVNTSPSQELFGLADCDATDPSILSFQFAFVESGLVDVGNEEGTCVGTCPIVQIGGKKLGAIIRRPDLDDEGESIVGFAFEYPLSYDDWGEVDQQLAIALSWRDLAGNIASFALPENVRFDFIPPTASDCLLEPDTANANSMLTYSLTTSEQLADWPEVAVTAGGADLFSPEPAVSGGGFTYTWTAPASSVVGDHVAMSASLKDEAQNSSVLPVCSATAEVDLAGPTIEEVIIATEPPLQDDNKKTILACNHGDTIRVSFMAVDNQSIAEEEPEVSLTVAGTSIPFAMDDKVPTADGTEFIFELPIDEMELAGEEGYWPVRVALSDLAGNVKVEEGLAGALVKLDFTPPDADCSLIPAPGMYGYHVGEKLALQVTPFEQLETDFLPIISEDFTPPFEGPYLKYEEGTSYRFVQVVQDVDNEREFELTVRLRDLVGNETANGATACVGGVLDGAIDGTVPKIVGLQISPDGDAPLRKGDLIEAMVTIDNTDLQPEVMVGSGYMKAVPEEPELLPDGTSQWTFQRTLDETEGHGLQMIAIVGNDASGNHYTNAGNEPEVALDFVAPEAQCVLNLATAKAGETVRLTVTFTEPLMGGQAELVSGLEFEVNDELSNPDAQQPKFVFDYPVKVGTKPLAWTYEVMAQDLAGNPVPAYALCTGQGTVDGESITVESSAVVAAFEEEEEPGVWVETGHYAKNGSRISIEFTLDELPVDSIPVLTIGADVVTSHTLIGKSYTFTHIVDAEGMAGTAVEPVVIEVADQAGNKTLQTVELLLFDYDSPSLSGQAYLERCDGYSDARVTQDELWAKQDYTCEYQYNPAECGVGVDAVAAPIRVSFALNEPVLPESRRVYVDNSDLALDECLSKGNYLVALYLPSGEEPQNDCRDVMVSARDLAGNLADIPVGCLRFDYASPNPPAVETPDKVTYLRVPWGDDTEGGQIAFRVVGVEGAVDGAGSVLAFDPATSWQIGTAASSTGGAFSLLLTPDNRPSVNIAFVDKAGNPSNKVPVRDVTWVATMGGKVAGSTLENPNVFRSIPAFTSLRLRGGIHEVGEGSGLGSTEVDGAMESGYGAGYWTQVGSADIPDARYEHSMAFQLASGKLLLFGGRLESHEYAPGNTWEWDAASRAWELVAATGPQGRSTASMAYDLVRDKVIMFGGYSPGGCGEGAGEYCGYTWEWDSSGSKWKVVSQTGPKAGNESAMAYDEVHQKIVLFQATVNNPYGETWVWDCSERLWEKVAETGPQKRRLHAMAYDGSSSRVLLFGGFNNSSCEETGQRCDYTWLWDGGLNQWELAATSGPKARKEHAMAYDRVRKRVVLFGGDDGSLVGDLWEWDGDKWLELPVQGPTPAARQNHGMAFNPETGAVLVMGGENYLNGCDEGWGAKCGYVWQFNAKTKSWNKTTSLAPVGRSNASLAYHQVLERVVLFGGVAGGGCGEPVPPQDSSSKCSHTWLWNGLYDAWEDLSYDDPFPRYDHLMAYDASQEEILMWGGTSPTDCGEGFGGRCRHTWSWSGETKEWSLGTTAGPFETKGLYTGHSAAMDYAETTKTMLLIGEDSGRADCGIGLDKKCSYTWEWNGASGSWTVAADSGPLLRSGHAVAFDERTAKLVLFGGQSSSQGNCTELPTGKKCGDTWEWNVLAETWSRESISGPNPRKNHALTYDVERQKVVLHGGYGGSGCDEDAGNYCGYVWEWDSAQKLWKTVSTEGPLARSGQAATFDTSRGKVVVFGGKNESGCEEGAGEDCSFVWEWDGGAEAVPAQVVYISLADQISGVDHELQEATVRWKAGGVGYDSDGLPKYGVQVKVWDEGKWKEVAVHETASPEEPQWVSWSTSEPLQLSRMFFGDEQYLISAISPLHPNGPGSADDPDENYGRIEVEYVEGTVKYRSE